MSIKDSKRAIIAWCFYDWANSAFPTLVMTFIFATYYTGSVAKTAFIGTARWGDMIAISGILIAILSPVFGAIADHLGYRKHWLAAFTALMVLSTAALWWMKPEPSYEVLMLVLVGLGVIGLEIGGVFYNSMLRSLATDDYIGRISGWGWGFGYAGGLLCLIIVLFAFVNPHTAIFAFDHRTAEHVRICGPFVALWIFIFALPLFFWTPDRSVVKKGATGHIIRDAFTTLGQTLRTLPKRKAIFIFLIAHMLYIDGLNTLFAFGGIYASDTFHFTMSQVLLFGISLNVTAGLGAAGFAWLDDFWGPKPTILVSLFLMLIAGIGALIVRSEIIFWALAMILGIFVGPVQAASRSLLARLSPPELISELFGLYAFSGKATAFLNPWLVGTLTLAFHSQRIGMASVMVFMLIGALLLTRVRVTAI